MKVRVHKDKMGEGLTEVKEAITKKYSHKELAGELLELFDHPENSEWLRAFQNRFVYVYITTDLRITINEKGILCLHLNGAAEIQKLPEKLRRNLTQKIVKLFQGGV